MVKVSIIVPVYNVEKYLSKCIESILNQTLNDFELILVNDGSTDNSAKICEEYRIKDSRIILINKENGGLSSARNAGLDIAKGKYIGFVDSDDFIDPQMYEILYNLCLDYNCNISSCVSKLIMGEQDINKEYSEEISILDSKEAINLTLDGQLSNYSVCSKLFLKELFEGISFPEGRIYEDVSVYYKLYMKSNKVLYIDKLLYYYMYRENSITKSKFSEKRFDIVTAFDEKYEFMKINYPEICDKIKSVKYKNIRNIIVDIVNEGTYIKNYKYIKEASKFVRKDIKYILKNPLITKNHKLLAIIISYIPRISIFYYLKKSTL